MLTRGIQTAHLALEEAGLLWLPVQRSWRLNERHYGALQGKDKAATRREFGDERDGGKRRIAPVCEDIERAEALRERVSLDEGSHHGERR